MENASLKSNKIKFLNTEYDWYDIEEEDWVSLLERLKNSKWQKRNLKIQFGRHRIGKTQKEFQNISREVLINPDRVFVESFDKSKKTILGFYSSTNRIYLGVDINSGKILTMHRMWVNEIKNYYDITDFSYFPKGYFHPIDERLEISLMPNQATRFLNSLFKTIDKGIKLECSELFSVAGALSFLKGRKPKLDKMYAMRLAKFKNKNIWGEQWYFNPDEITAGTLPLYLIPKHVRKYLVQKYYKYKKMNTIKFKIVQRKIDSGRIIPCIGIFVDEKNLRDDLREFELPMATKEGHPNLAGSNIEMGIFNFPSNIFYFLGQIRGVDGVWKFKSNLFICSCGDKYCSATRCKIKIKRDIVQWSNFEYINRNDKSSKNYWDYSSFPDFIFDKVQYISALNNLAFEIHNTILNKLKMKNQELLDHITLEYTKK